MKAEKTGLKVLFVASECAPWAKSGGLGDVVAALPKALEAEGVEVRTVLPLYGWIGRAGLEWKGGLEVECGYGGREGCGVWEGGEGKVWFLEHNVLYDRAGIYGDGNGEFGDQARRFGLLCAGAAELCRREGWIPDVVHTHDWPTAAMGGMLESWRRDGRGRGLEKTGSVLTIHNMAHQGWMELEEARWLGLRWETMTQEGFEAYGKLNLLKGGIAWSDAVTTVSPTYARECLGEPGGCGLSWLLGRRGSDFSGVLNGADYETWNPERDGRIAAGYGHNSLIGKGACKRDLQLRMGLAADDRVPVLGMVTRLAEQKGLGLLHEALPGLLAEGRVQLAVLGSGERWAEEWLGWLAREWPGRVGVQLGYSEDLAHQIYAGSDFFLMPSLFEPCGLSQLYAMRYGALPVVRATGGLEDTVEGYDARTGGGTGFKFAEASGAALRGAMDEAVGTWYERPTHVTMMRERGMARRFGWEGPAKEYLAIYERVAGRRR